MNNNIFFNNYRNYRTRCNSSLFRQFLTPCDILSRYLIDPCSIFNGTILPIPPIPPIPPPLPPIPPMPPLPPGPLRSFGEFRAPMQQVDSGDLIVFNTVDIQGNDIEHEDGTIDILLAPNTTYEFEYITETAQIVASPVGFAFVLGLDGVNLRNSITEIDNAPAGVPFMTQIRGQFMTGNNQGVLRLRYISQPNLIATTNATLVISVV